MDTQRGNIPISYVDFFDQETGDTSNCLVFYQYEGDILPSFLERSETSGLAIQLSADKNDCNPISVLPLHGNLQIGNSSVSPVKSHAGKFALHVKGTESFGDDNVASQSRYSSVGAVNTSIFEEFSSRNEEIRFLLFSAKPEEEDENNTCFSINGLRRHLYAASPPRQKQYLPSSHESTVSSGPSNDISHLSSRLILPNLSAHSPALESSSRSQAGVPGFEQTSRTIASLSERIRQVVCDDLDTSDSLSSSSCTSPTNSSNICHTNSLTDSGISSVSSSPIYHQADRISVSADRVSVYENTQPLSTLEDELSIAIGEAKRRVSQGYGTEKAAGQSDEELSDDDLASLPSVPDSPSNSRVHPDKYPPGSLHVDIVEKCIESPCIVSISTQTAIPDTATLDIEDLKRSRSDMFPIRSFPYHSLNSVKDEHMRTELCKQFDRVSQNLGGERIRSTSRRTKSHTKTNADLANCHITSYIRRNSGNKNLKRAPSSPAFFGARSLMPYKDICSIPTLHRSQSVESFSGSSNIAASVQDTAKSKAIPFVRFPPPTAVFGISDAFSPAELQAALQQFSTQVKQCVGKAVDSFQMQLQDMAESYVAAVTQSINMAVGRQLTSDIPINHLRSSLPFPHSSFNINPFQNIGPQPLQQQLPRKGTPSKHGFRIGGLDVSKQTLFQRTKLRYTQSCPSSIVNSGENEGKEETTSSDSDHEEITTGIAFEYRKSNTES